MYERKTPFHEAIDVNDYKQLAGITRCTTNDHTDNYERSSDPSYETATNLCRGYKNLTSTLIDCDGVGGASVKRLCKCVDKGLYCGVMFQSRYFAKKKILFILKLSK